jgi:predicted nucleotidyltransferase
MSDIPEAIKVIAKQLNKLPYDFAFLGGAVLEVLITDKGAPSIRTTKDVDVVVNVPSRKAYTTLEEELRNLGFKHDTSEGAPICRWTYQHITLDIMPPSEKVLGWKTLWLGEALEHAEIISGDPSIRIVKAPYFLATKIEAFYSRGENDFCGSHDLEDIISVFNGRETLVEEIRGSQERLRSFLTDHISSWLKNPLFLDSLNGHLADEEHIIERKQIVLERLHAVAKRSLLPS